MNSWQLNQLCTTVFSEKMDHMIIFYVTHVGASKPLNVIWCLILFFTCAITVISHYKPPIPVCIGEEVVDAGISAELHEVRTAVRL